METISQKPVYENCTILHPNGQPLFRCSRKKVLWYIRRNLAVVESHDPLIARLLFAPKGPGNASDKYLMEDKANRCVVCGSPDRLTRHHIVPYCYRKCMHHVPQYIGDHHDILPMCYDCHDIYEHKFADHLKAAIARRYNAPLTGVGWDINSPENIIVRTAGALDRHRSQMPAHRIKELTERITVLLGHTPTDSEVAEIANRSENNRGPDFQTHAELVVKQVDLEKFISMWRRHFVHKMNPKFLPDNWDINRKIQWNRV